MKAVYLLNERTHDYVDTIRAFESLEEANEEARRMLDDYFAEIATIQALEILFDQYVVDYPEPELKRVIRSECKDAEDYEFKNSFYEPVYHSIYEQEYEEWLQNWRATFEDHIKFNGLAPLELHEEYWRRDRRIFGYNDVEYRDYEVIPVQLVPKRKSFK